MGFDAPRAFTLVSMRGAQDKDFGTQIVGRILRVDRRLQGRELPDLLKYGYVFLADAEKQSGLAGAADRINAVRTELAQVSPFTMLVKLGDSPTVQVVESGQTSLLPKPWTPSLPEEMNPIPDVDAPLTRQDTLSGFILEANDWQGAAKPAGEWKVPSGPAPGMKSYSLRSGMERVFRREQLNLDTSGLLRAVEARIRLDDSVLTAGFRQAVSIQRKEEEIFSHDVHYGEFQARLSDAEIARRAQLLLFEPDYLDPRELQSALLNRLRRECSERGFLEILESPEKLRRAMHLILVSYPNLLRDAVRASCAENAELVDTAALPESVCWPLGCAVARLASYQVFPPDLNKDEKALAQLFDGDLGGSVEWWHRNEPRKPWSIGLVLPDGHHYYPDFAVKVKGRSKGDGILLIEVKGEHLLNSLNTQDKAVASHKLYRAPLMVTKEASGRWMTLRFNDKTGKNEPDTVFRLDALAQY